MKISKTDWKTFQESLPELRERYLAEQNKTFIAILNDDKRTPTEQFWDTYEAMNKQGKILRDCLDGYSKSKMGMHILLMHRYGMMKNEDLEAYSEELRNWVLQE